MSRSKKRKEIMKSIYYFFSFIVEFGVLSILFLCIGAIGLLCRIICIAISECVMAISSVLSLIGNGLKFMAPYVKKVLDPMMLKDDDDDDTIIFQEKGDL